MASSELSKSEHARFKICPVKCRKIPSKIQSLAEFFAVISSTIAAREPFWFRGHARAKWSLTPSALRFPSERERDAALKLISEFKRIAEIKLKRPPPADDDLKWAQVAQHNGLPTRLLDWTESATVALFFACEKPEADGMIFVLNPIDLNRLTIWNRKGTEEKPRILDSHSDGSTIKKYLRLGAIHRPRGRGAIAINPIWNSERLMLQRGVFTLHGGKFHLDSDQAPSLVAIPILRGAKSKLRDELERIGVDEMTIFPELEHSCSHLRRKNGLEAME